MLRALTRLFRRASDTAQLELGIAPTPPRTADELLSRLRHHGLTRIDRCLLTHNRNVMVSFGHKELRVHQGYLAAPEPVLRAIVTFVQGRTRADRRVAQRIIVAHPIATAARVRRREQTHADDDGMAEQLAAWHARYNDTHFGGRLARVAVRVSRRMKSRLGHYTAATPPGHVSFGGTALVADKDYFATVDATGQRLWLIIGLVGVLIDHEKSGRERRAAPVADAAVRIDANVYCRFGYLRHQFIPGDAGASAPATWQGVTEASTRRNVRHID